MRQLGTLPSEEQAQRLADYLLTIQIDTRLDREGEGWAIWVCDEDRLGQARQEYAEFKENPTEPRFVEAGRQAQGIRLQKTAITQQYERKQEQLARRMAYAGTAGRGWTFALIVISVLVAVGTGMGKDITSPLFQSLTITPFQLKGEFIEWFGLNAIQAGEVWRLVTPIFIHFGPIHLFFNLFLLHDLGGVIERRRGAWRFLGLVLVIAVLSNLAEYYVEFSMATQGLMRLDKPSPNFGGMSGVLYGLFGYAWMKTRHQPELGIIIHESSIMFLMIWFFLCLFGVIEHVANTAHAVGLLVGLAIGYAPTFWRSLRR
jgi:GlpG protein